MAEKKRQTVLEFERLLSETFRLSQKVKSAESVTLDKIDEYVKNVALLSETSLKLHENYNDINKTFIRGNI